MLFLWIVWAALTLFVISLAVMRKIAARKEDDLLHLSGSPEPMIAQQFATAGKLAKIDHWGTVLTVVDAAFGVVLLVTTLVMTYLRSVSLQQ